MIAFKKPNYFEIESFTGNYIINTLVKMSENILRLFYFYI